MAFTLILLTVYPEYQSRVQEELDAQLGGLPKEEWTVKHDYQALQKGYVGAAIKEVLRLYCVVQFILRRTATAMPVLDSKGKSHLIPENTLCLLNFSAAFQNPATWPERKVSPQRRAELHDSPAINFDPSRWFEAAGHDETESKDSDISAFFPFGQGPRSCVGRAFAQIEMTAAIATVFKDHSLELVVDEQTTRACNGDSKLTWEKTRDKALRILIDDVEANINIQLLKELPIRVVRREA